jgi:aminoglycoside phosphotransferase (APT) family kinase protein
LRARSVAPSWYDRAFAVELAAQAAGVPMPRPVPAPGTGRGYAELPGPADRPATVRVHVWVDGRMPAPGDDLAALARAVGRLLAAIHALRLPSEQRAEDLIRVRGSAHWQELSRSIQQAGVAWADRFRDLLPVIAEIETAVVAGRAGSGVTILSHRDVDPKNVLIDAARAIVLLDWDSAAPTDPQHELVTAALDWSGVHEGEPDPTVMRAMLDGYRSGGGATPRPDPTLFAGFYQTRLNWLEYNVRRSLGERLQGEDRRRLAEREALLEVENLPRFAASAPRWTAMLC